MYKYVTLFYFLISNIALAQFTPVKGTDLGATVEGGAYSKDRSMSRKVIPYPHLREADVMWSKRVWRKIDMREKINHPYYFPTEEIQDRKSMMQLLIQSVSEGAITAYGNAAFDDEFQEPMTVQEVKDMLVKKDTIHVPNADNPDVMEAKYIERKLDPSSVKTYLLKEDWFFDKQRSLAHFYQYPLA